MQRRNFDTTRLAGRAAGPHRDCQNRPKLVSERPGFRLGPLDRHMTHESPEQRLKRLRESAERALPRLPEVGSLSAPEARKLVHDLRVYQVELEMQNDELRRTQTALEQSRDRFSELYDFAPVGYLSLDRSGMIVEANITFAEMMQVDRAALIRKPLVEFVAEESRPEFRSRINAFLRKPDSRPWELALQPRAGSEIFARLSGRRVPGRTAILTVSGETTEVPAECRVAVFDVTARHDAEVARARSESLYRLLADNTSDLLWTTDLDGRTTYVSPSVRSLLGVSQDAFVATGTPTSWVMRTRRDEVQQMIAAAAQDRPAGVGGERRTEVQIARADGSHVWIELVIAPLLDGTGARVGTLGTGRDITDRKEADAQFAAQRDISAELAGVSTLDDALLHLAAGIRLASGLDGVAVYVRDASPTTPGESGSLRLTQRLGLGDRFATGFPTLDAPSPLVGPNGPELRDLTADDMAGTALAAEGLQSASVIPVTHESQVIAAVVIASHTREDPPAHSRRAAEAIIAQVGGVLGRLRAEEALRRRQALVDTFVANVPIDFWARNESGRVIVQSRESKGVWGTLVGTVPTRPADPDATAPLLIPDRFDPAQTPPSTIDHELPIGDGQRVRHVRALHAPIVVDGRVIGDVGVNIDLTELREQEAAVRAGEARLKSVLAAVPDEMAVFDRDGTCRDLVAGPTFLGLTADRLVGARAADLLPADVAATFRTGLDLAWTQSDPASFEFPIEIDAQQRWCMTTFVPVGDSGTQRVLVVVHDLTDRREVEQRLARSEALLKQAQTLARIGSWELDPHRGVMRWSDNLREIVGLDAEAGPDLDRLAAALGDDGADFRSAVIAAAKSGDAFNVDLTIRHPSGRPRYLRAMGRGWEHDGLIRRVMGTIQDVTQLHEQIERLRESESRFRQMAENIRHVFWLRTADEMLYISPAYEEIWGRPCDELYRDANSFMESIHPDEREMVVAELFRSWNPANDYRFDMQYRIVRPDGEVRWIWARNWGAGTVNGKERAAGFAEDITALKLAEEGLREGRDAAQAASRAKSDFLANMSHEIRTPMNGVLGMAELLLLSELAPRQREYCETILQSSRGLLTIIDDILDFSRIEAGRLDLAPRTTDLVDSVEQVAQLLAGNAHDKGLDFAVRFGPGVPRQVVMDGGRVRQILVNLVSNAIKFTHSGYVTIGVSAYTAEPEAEDDGSNGESASAGRFMLRLEVSDTGIGIAPDDRDRIFEHFTQAGRPDGSGRGTGLGLTICRRLTDMMGGRLKLESRVGEGSTFIVDLPLEPAGDDDALPPAPDEVRERRALIAMRPGPTRDALRDLLTRWGMRVDATGTLHSAVGELDLPAGEANVDLLVVGAELLDPDSALFRHLRRVLSEFPDIATILLVPATTVSRGVTLTPLQATLPRPPRLAALTRSVRRLLRSAADPARHDDTTTSVRPITDRFSADVIVRFDARALVAEDNPFNQRVVLNMLDSFGVTADVAADGAEALERMREGGYDIVYMDWWMPGVDGLTATRRWREREAEAAKDDETGAPAKRLPIVALTANAMEDAEAKCLEAGMDGYLCKPISLDAIRSSLNQWCADRRGDVESGVDIDRPVLSPRSVGEAEPMPATDERPIDDRPVWDEAHALRTAMNDRTVLRQASGLFREQLRLDLTRLRDAVRASDPIAIRDTSHRIKGAASTFGALRLSGAALALEQCFSDDGRRDGGCDEAKVRRCCDRITREAGALESVFDGYDWGSPDDDFMADTAGEADRSSR
jgi:two-component system sensor histidine kinase/response regulator